MVLWYFESPSPSLGLNCSEMAQGINKGNRDKMPQAIRLRALFPPE